MKLFEKAAESYATGVYRASFADNYEQRAFEAGVRWTIDQARRRQAYEDRGIHTGDLLDWLEREEEKQSD